MNTLDKIDIKTLDELYSAKQDKNAMLTYYGISESEFDELTPEKYHEVNKTNGDVTYQDLRRQLWHDYRVYLQDIYTANQPKIVKVTDIRKQIAKKINLLNASEKRFIDGLKGKRKLTVRQEKWFRDIADKVGVKIDGEFENKLSQKEKYKSSYNSNCQHEDLGSLGYTHGTTVKCPNCGKMAEVW